MSALIQTLKCTADLIEDLLQEGLDYVLICRLESFLPNQSNPGGERPNLLTFNTGGDRDK